MSIDPSEMTIDLGKARDQGARPTCLSFSLSEIHRVAISLTELLSPESIHRQATARAKKPASEGLTLGEAANSLKVDGQTTEVDWPYHMETAANDCGFYQIDAAPLKFRHKTVVDSITSGRPLGLLVDIDQTFFVHTKSTPLDLSPVSQVQGRHAVALCGFRLSSAGCDYLIKNSWGDNWGLHGYGWLTSAHVLARSPLLVQV